MSDCGENRESCCANLEVQGGTFARTYDAPGPGPDGGFEHITLAADGAPTGLADPATVSTFRLDKYLVTVGRFRQFVSAWSAGYRPAAGSGKHTHLNGGLGLASSDAPGSYEAGWVAADDGNVAPTDANLSCDASYATWTPSVGSQEGLPINCLNWWEARAFCIWDGAFLPSHAEAEYAAAGGSEQREYPWGSTNSGTSSQYAIYACDYGPNDAGACTGVANLAPVGTTALGAGRWGQLDLAGEVYEWAADWLAPYVNPCMDCALLGGGAFKVYRGAVFEQLDIPEDLLPATFGFAPPESRDRDVGLRCARTP